MTDQPAFFVPRSIGEARPLAKRQFSLEAPICRCHNARMTEDVAFALAPELARDTHELGRWPLSLVLLMNDRRFPWLILVPRRAGLAELLDLDPSGRTALLDEVVRASEALKAEFKPHKLNVAALGNMVRQLHVHVVARYPSDAAWPKPIWGVGTAEPYGADELKAVSARLRAALKL